MEQVNVYLYTTIKGAKHCNGAYTYTLEMQTSKGPGTLTKTEIITGVTAHQAELAVLAAALKRIFRQCSLTIYTDSNYLASGAEKWMKQWEKNDWKNAKGSPVANAEEWKELACLLQIHTYCFVVGKTHTYYEWMRSEAEKAGKQCTK